MSYSAPKYQIGDILVHICVLDQNSVIQVENLAFQEQRHYWRIETTCGISAPESAFRVATEFEIKKAIEDQENKIRYEQNRYIELMELHAAWLKRYRHQSSLLSPQGTSP